MKKFFKTNILFFVLFIGLQPTLSRAESYNFSSENYEEAKKAESNIKFDMASTKVGLFTSHFTGFVKKFSVSGEKHGNSIHNTSIEFVVKELEL